MTLYQSALLRDHQSSAVRLIEAASLPTDPGELLTDAQVGQIDLRESLTLEMRRFRAVMWLRLRGKYILDQGAAKPAWGQPDPDYVRYATPFVAIPDLRETEAA